MQLHGEKRVTLVAPRYQPLLYVNGKKPPDSLDCAQRPNARASLG